MALLEGAEAARATASGMAAVTAALMGQLRAGDHVVAARALFGSCRYVVEDLLPRFGVASTLVDGADLEPGAQAVRPNTKAAVPRDARPTRRWSSIDIAGGRRDRPRGRRQAGRRQRVRHADLQQPLRARRRFVVYSATKHIDGQGRVLGGVILGSEEFIDDHVHNSCARPAVAVAVQRLGAAEGAGDPGRCASRAQTAHAPRSSPTSLARPPARSTRVLYPGRADHPQAALARRQMTGGGTMIAFEVEGGKAGGVPFANALS